MSYPPPETCVARQNSVTFRPIRHEDSSYDSCLSDQCSELDRGMEVTHLRPSGPRLGARAADFSGLVHSSSTEDVPHHWWAVGLSFVADDDDDDDVNADDDSLSRKSEQAYWALRKLRSREAGFCSEMGESPPLGCHGGSDESTVTGGSSSLWDDMGSNHSANHSTRTECSPLKPNVRRRAKALVGCAALAALIVAAIRLLAHDHPAFGLVSRKLFRGGGNGTDAVPIPWLPSEGQDEDPEEEAASPQEKTRRAREERLRDHEEQVRLQLAARKQRESGAAARRGMLQDARHPDAYYYNFSDEDGPTAPQDGQYRRMLRGVDLDQDGDEEGYNFQYRGYVQGIDGEYRDDGESSHGFLMVKALLEGLEREHAESRR